MVRALNKKKSNHSALVDVSLLLALLFLSLNAISFHANKQIVQQIQMAAAKHTQKMKTEGAVNSFSISMDQNGKILIGEDSREIALQDIEKSIPYAETYELSIDKSVSYGDFIKIISACKAQNEYASILNKVIKEK